MGTTQPIPAAVLDLLKARWKPDSTRFENVWEDERRRSDPSFYIYYDRPHADGIQTFTPSEIRQLVQANVLDRLVKQNATSMAVNEHAEHALSDFCGEVYAAWAKFQDRLEAISTARAGA